MDAAEKILNLSESSLQKAPRDELVQIILVLRLEIDSIHNSYKKKLEVLNNKLAQRDLELAKLTKANINQTVNQPSSKQPEYAKNTGKKLPKKRGKGRKGRKGAGNRSKIELKIDVVNKNPLDCCPKCQSDLTDQPIAETVSRIVEDIMPVPAKTIVSKEVQERKWCASCNEIVSSVSEAALPQSDIGLRALILIAYLWVVSAISLPGIAAFLNNFFHLRLSTAGLSRMMIRLGKIFKPVHDEILSDVKGGAIIFADETGWRVKGILWWLWIFANDRTAYYWPDKQRGSPVVEKILGTIFSGVLVTDAWCAYQKIVCHKQTCMAHIMRKIRKFRDAYPQYYSIMTFYQKLRRILADGERLKLARKKIGEEVFNRRLNLLKFRLEKLLSWKSPNAVLKEVISKVARQSAYILTFIEFPGVPKHNNFGEYIIKKGILKRKVSGGSMSEDGAMAYAVLQSIAQTCHLRRISFFSFLTTSLTHYIRTGSPLLLGMYEKTNLEQQKSAA